MAKKLSVSLLGFLGLVSGYCGHRLYIKKREQYLNDAKTALEHSDYKIIDTLLRSQKVDPNAVVKYDSVQNYYGLRCHAKMETTLACYSVLYGEKMSAVFAKYGGEMENCLDKPGGKSKISLAVEFNTTPTK